MKTNIPRKQVRLSRWGASAVEFAFIAPVFFLLVIGLLEFGRLVMVQQAVSNAAREGCRKAVLATTQSSADAETEVRNYLAGTIRDYSNPSVVKVTISPSNLSSSTQYSTMTSGTEITVTVSVDFSKVTWVPGNLLGFGSSPIITGAATMQRE